MARFGYRIRRRTFFAAAVMVLSSLGAAAAGPALKVVSASPAGETAKIEECNEIRILFSEPMVDLGRIPDEVKAPFVSIAPPLRGQFRWSGTRLLVFTPDPASPLPFCTEFKVSVAATAVSASGHALEEPY
ncbi:MAG: Ig-like domain-containing protein, partial [Candidatus Gracilibacteria bacterium]|nr:Ig-like domain-containing protein [Candidatus Gracilibacteria bacterium]